MARVVARFALCGQQLAFDRWRDQLRARAVAARVVHRLCRISIDRAFRSWQHNASESAATRWAAEGDARQAELQAAYDALSAEQAAAKEVAATDARH